MSKPRSRPQSNSRSRSTSSASLGFLLPSVANVFEVLRVSAAIRDGGPWRAGIGTHWHAIHAEPSLPDFELEHGREYERDKYNVRAMNEALATQQLVRGEHAGLSDRFVPIVVDGTSVGVLASGPFATARSTSAQVLARWRWLTGRQGHPADPEFLHYLSMTLSTLVLDGDLSDTFDRFLVCFARLLGGSGDARTLAESERLAQALERARFAERIWKAARSMVHEQSAHGWSSPHMAPTLEEFGLRGVPEGALVGLIATRTGAAMGAAMDVATAAATGAAMGVATGVATGVDPVDEALRRDGFQRACVDIALDAGNALAGQVGDYGVVFLIGPSGAKRTASARRVQQRAIDLADKATHVARREFGLALHFGRSGLTASAPLSEHYQAALAAAEAALSRGVRMVDGAPLEHTTFALHELRRRLAEVVEERPNELAARFERYYEAVALHCGYRLEPARGHLEAGFELVAGALLDAGSFDEKTFADMSRGLAKEARDARTLTELFAVYRRAVDDMSAAATQPTRAHQDRSLRRAVAYIHRHYAERLPRTAVARAAGFAPNYFSALFKRQQRMTFERYLLNVRLERAKQLLAGTDLPMARIAELSGFRTRFYLGEVFRRELGQTPVDWRRERLAGKPARRRRDSTKT